MSQQQQFTKNSCTHNDIPFHSGEPRITKACHVQRKFTLAFTLSVQNISQLTFWRDILKGHLESKKQNQILLTTREELTNKQTNEREIKKHNKQTKQILIKK
jgi:hypothetical protein